MTASILHVLYVLLWLSVNIVCLETKKPHIIFILADDLGWNDVSLHGSTKISTPNIDAFGRDGIILNNYYVMPLCTPSRGALLTGKYPIRLGLQHFVIRAPEPWGLPRQERILPQFLKGLGYATHGIGKWHLGFYKKDYLPTNRGFDSFFGSWSGSGDYYSHFKADSIFYGYDFHDNERTSWENEGLYSTDVFTKKAKSIIESHNTSQPLFLYLCHQAVHTGNSNCPLQSPPKYTKNLSSFNDPEKVLYAGLVNSLDQSVGELFASLEVAGMLNDSIVIFSSDNGAAVRGMNGSAGSNWPLRGTKFTLWEGGIRAVAWIWSSQLRRRSRVDNHMFHISDWLPTLFAAAGGDVKELGKIDGKNQWPTLLGDQKSKREHMLLNIDPVIQLEGVRKGPFKLIKGTYKTGKYDGWFDQDGKQIQFSSQLHSNDLCTKSMSYRESLASSLASKILWKNFHKNASAFGSENLESFHTSCGKKTEIIFRACFPQQSRCLFNVEKDPCEYYNVAEAYPEVADDLEDLLSEYREQAITPLNEPSDEAADPKLHGGVWLPWR